MQHLSRHDDQAKAKIDLDRCIENAMNLCQFDLKHIPVHLDMDSDLPPIIGNAQQIEQVLINLLRNAVDAMASVKSPELNLTAKKMWGKCMHFCG